MFVDALTLCAVADELATLLAGARVEDVIQPTPQAIAMQCWTGTRTHWLLLSAHPQHARLHVTQEKPRKLTSEPPPFVMLLRKHLEGQRVLAVRQPRWERLVELGFGRRTGEGAASDPLLWLIIEVMGRISNLVLCDADGVILGSLRQVGAEVNRYREIAPHIPYKYPPPQQRQFYGQQVPRLEGTTLTGEELRLGAQGNAPPTTTTPRLWQMLAGQVLGFSPLLAREAVNRAVGDAEALVQAELPWERIAEQVRGLASLYDTRQWQPVLLEQPNEGTPRGFAVYEVRHRPDLISRPMERINEVLDCYFRGVEWRDALTGTKADVLRVLQTHRERCLRKAELLGRDLAETQAGEKLRIEGEVLLAFGQEIAPGQANFTIENPFATGDSPELLKIALDPHLTVVENANRRFARYHKLRRAGAQIPEQIERNRAELAHLEQLLTDLQLAETPAEVVLVRAEVVEAGYLRTNKQDRQHKGSKGKAGKQGKTQQQKRVDAGAPLRQQSSEGFLILVGKNSRQNEEVTFREAGSNDLWLHARGVPGAHVIIKSGGRQVPHRTLEEAARLAAYYSQSRGNSSVPVDYTQQRYVRHMKSGGPGMVIYERERTLSVAPEEGQHKDGRS
ncbi:MAG TPA: NFACT RNA binding domain-containing protein [Ktedonobacterales bacterium]|jgi:predicted ribosome quality control (RQC) complex YloA/Tae2 family protein